MQQLNVYDYYELGKKVDEIVREIAKDGPLPKTSIAWPLFLLRWHFNGMLTEPCALLPASQRAAKNVTQALSAVLPDQVEEVFKIDKDEILLPYQAHQIAEAIKDFETVLKNDLPEMSTFAVAQIGIYRTEDLINKSYCKRTRYPSGA